MTTVRLQTGWPSPGWHHAEFNYIFSNILDGGLAKVELKHCMRILVFTGGTALRLPLSRRRVAIKALR